jgi:protein phosphatase
MQVCDVALFTHRGVVRARNEDAIFVGGSIHQADLRDVITVRLIGTPHVLMVADGIGGQPKGDFASRTALQFLSSDPGLVDSPVGCEAALHAVNGRLYELMDDPARISMGTTVAGLVLHDAAVIAFNVGDSRAYRWGSAGLRKMSREDVADCEGQADRSHAITQALGGSPFPLAIVPHICVGPSMQIGERFLLCTDGLTDAIDDDEIQSMLQSSEPPAVTATKLVRRAIRGGSRDNISVVLGMLS